MRASGISAQPPVQQPAQAADARHAAPSGQRAAAAPTEPPSAEVADLKTESMPSAGNDRVLAALLAAQAKQNAAEGTAPGLPSISTADVSKPPPAQPAAGSAAPESSAAFKKELMERFNKGDATVAELRKFYQDVLQGDGLSGIVAQISSWEEASNISAEAVKVVSDMIDAAKREEYARILTACLDAVLVPTVVEATSKYRHCDLFPQTAFTLLGKISALADKALVDNAALETTVTRVKTELAAATDICLCYISTQQSSTTGLSCESAFLFLATMFGEARSCTAFFHEYALQHGDRVIRLCLAALRKCRGRGASWTSDAAAEMFMELVISSDHFALSSLQLNAVDVLISVAPIADTLLSEMYSSTLGFIANALCAILRAVNTQIPVVFDLEMSQTVLAALMMALRNGILNEPAAVLETVELLFQHRPALVSVAVKVGALDLVDANDESSVVEKFVDRVKALMQDAEASAAAAAADLLAAEDAEQARAAAKAARPKRAKKPAASTSVAPPPAENDTAGEQPLTDPSLRAAGQAPEPSQSESAMRRRRRAATKAVRRAAAAARVQRGGKAAADSSEDNDERSAAGDDAPPPPASGAVERSSRLDAPAAVAAQQTEVIDGPLLADLFPWMALSDAAPSPAAQLKPPAQAEASQPEAAPPAVTPQLPPHSSPHHVPFERFEALRAELTCAKSELARAKDELMLAKDELDASKCVICLSAPRCVAVLPCRHLPLCAAADCAAAMGAPPRCPLCRMGVTDTMRLFV